VFAETACGSGSYSPSKTLGSASEKSGIAAVLTPVIFAAATWDPAGAQNERIDGQLRSSQLPELQGLLRAGKSIGQGSGADLPNSGGEPHALDLPTSNDWQQRSSAMAITDTGANRGIGLEYLRQMQPGELVVGACRMPSPELERPGCGLEAGLELTSAKR